MNAGVQGGRDGWEGEGAPPPGMGATTLTVGTNSVAARLADSINDSGGHVLVRQYGEGCPKDGSSGRVTKPNNFLV